MRVRLNVIIASVITILIGTITLIGLLTGDNLGQISFYIQAVRIPDVARFFLQLAVVTAAATIFVGIINLLVVHFTRLRRGRGSPLNRLNSLVLLIVFFATLAIYFYEKWQGTPPENSLSRVLLEDVQIASEASLAGLLFFALVYGAFRVLRRDVTLPRVVFVATILVVLIGSLPIPALNVVTRFSNWLMAYPVSAGARGMLLGIALATLVLGVRVLIGQDRAISQD
jgi:hypothetical protein